MGASVLLLLAGPQLGEGPGQDSIMQRGQLSSRQAQGSLNHCTGAAAAASNTPVLMQILTVLFIRLKVTEW
jgi:hypothetical protein